MLSARQMKMRATGIGASECAAVAGYSSFATSWDIYNAKVYGIHPDETNAMRAGTFLEDGIARMYLETLGDRTNLRLHRSQSRRHPTERWMLATVDRDLIRVDNADRLERLVEIKVPGSRWSFNKAIGGREQTWGFYPDEIPPYIACQAQWQMEVRGADRCDVAAFFLDERELAVYPQVRNQKLIDSLVEINRRFWFDNVLAKVPPELDGSAAAGSYLRQVYPINGAAIVAAPPEAEEIARAYAVAQRDEKDAIARKDLCGNQLRALIGADAGVSDPWGKATWTLDSRGKVDWKAVAGDYRARVELLAQAAQQPDLASDLDQLAEARRAPANRVLRVTYKDSLEDAAPEPRTLMQVLQGGVA
jgi:putative phage-type endonuclease